MNFNHEKMKYQNIYKTSTAFHFPIGRSHLVSEVEILDHRFLGGKVSRGHTHLPSNSTCHTVDGLNEIRLQ